MTNYQQQLAQAQQVCSLGGAGYIGTGNAAVYPTGSTTSYPSTLYVTGVVNPGHQHQGYPAIAWPSPSGQIVSMAFTDMNGRAWSLDVDAAYVQILQIVSSQHQSIFQYRPNLGAPLPPAIKMLEGDFSEDEMSQAELIIQEMNRGLQEPCQCEA